MKRCNYNDEISKFKVYRVDFRQLVEDPFVQSVDDYNHSTLELHHFILFQSYSKNPDWYKTKGIEQKLILLPKEIHRWLHTCDENFLYQGFKWFELLFCRRRYEY